MHAVATRMLAVCTTPGAGRDRLQATSKECSLQMDMVFNMRQAALSMGLTARRS